MGEVPLYSCTPEALLQPEYRGTSLIRNRPPPRTPLGLYVVLLQSPRRGVFLVREIPLYPSRGE